MENKTNLKKVIFFKTVSPVHMGAGQGLEHIDLPIQREVHTKFPIFYASGIKGAFRQYALEKAYEQSLSDLKGKITLTDLDKWVEQYPSDETEKEKFEKQLREEIGEISDTLIDTLKKEIEILASIFGSQNRRGNLSISDAMILFFPVKSLKGVFAYVTCPLVLERYRELRGLEDLNYSPPEIGKIIASPNLVLDENKVILEEFEFEVKGKNTNWLEELKLPGELKKQIEQRVAIVDNDTFSYFVENFTEVVNRIKINPETGTVQEGALWTEEYLPAETVMYSFWFEKQPIEEDLKKVYLPRNNEIINIGGDQTVGKGLVKLFNPEVGNEKQH